MFDTAVIIPNATERYYLSTTSETEGYKVAIDNDLYIPKRIIVGQ